jgi:mono/diheme cytochrome c family protein
MNRFVAYLQIFAAFAPLLCFSSLVGCSKYEVKRDYSFEPNLVHTKKYEIRDSIPMDQASKDSFWIADQMFGTPDNPKLPECLSEDDDLKSIVSLDHLRRASGTDGTEGRGLFDRHCAKCHGVSGTGRGSLASVQQPYPRDFRMGVFKFKSSPRGAKPTKADIAKLIKHGIGGTMMSPIPELTDADISALVDYVIYLSMRGEVERLVVDSAMFDEILADGDRILDTQFASKVAAEPKFVERITADSEKEESSLDEVTKKSIEDYEAYDESWGYVTDTAIEVAESWLEAEEEAIEVDEKPSDLRVAESQADVLLLRNGPQAEAFNASVEKGRQLFLGKTAACSTCHGASGMGDGQTKDYDDWTKDWTVRMKLDPLNRDSLVPLLARGALEPKNVLPRNFAEGVFRGGKSSDELYRRITQGVDGTPMPAATFVAGEFEKQDVWHIINFIRTMEKPAAVAPE